MPALLNEAVRRLRFFVGFCRGGLLGSDLADQFGLLGQIFQEGQECGAVLAEQRDGHGRLAAAVLELVECLGNIQHRLGGILAAQVLG